MNILGVDIGFSGALSFYDGSELLIYDMPIYEVKKGNALDIRQLSQIIKTNKPESCYLERAMLMPSNGKSSYQKLGISQGAFEGILCALDIPYTIVAPAVWKSRLDCPKDKSAARMRASQLLPAHSHNWDLKKHDGRAEASLIALYGYNHLRK